MYTYKLYTVHQKINISYIMNAFFSPAVQSPRPPIHIHKQHTPTTTHECTLPIDHNKIAFDVCTMRDLHLLLLTAAAVNECLTILHFPYIHQKGRRAWMEYVCAEYFINANLCPTNDLIENGFFAHHFCFFEHFFTFI